MEPAFPEDRLVSYFQTVLQDRMQGMPIVNPKLSVAAVGFTDYQQDRVGVLITPWFMNLVLLPQGEFQASEQVGTKFTSSFPAGSYEFIVYSMEPEEAYRACSLFSPMELFEDQEAALATAAHVMEGLFNAEGAEPENSLENEKNLDSHQSEQRFKAILNSSHADSQTVALDVDPAESVAVEAEPLEPTLTTRRQLLRGNWLNGERSRRNDS